MKNFFRKVAFGIGPNEQAPSDPLKWALDQVNDVPELSWKGKIYSEKELRKHYRDWVYGDRKVLRKKYKDNKTLYKTHKDVLRHKTGQKFWESLEISIRHNEGINSSSPVLAKLWMFWGNFFAISEKDYLANYSTGPYQREIIRPNLNQTFEKMVLWEAPMRGYWPSLSIASASASVLVSLAPKTASSCNLESNAEPASNTRMPVSR